MLARLTRVRLVVLPYLRVLAALLALQLTFSAWSLHAAHAGVGDAMLTLGAQLMLYKNARKQSPPRRLVLNGLELQLSTGTSRDAPRAVLDQFAAMCKARAGQLGQQFAGLRERLTKEGADLGLLDGVLRAGDARRGAVACLDVGTDHLSIEDFVGRVERFVQSGDVAELGALRYVTVDGDASGSFFVALWSEHALNLGEAFPASGDVPGLDFAGAPRPEHARRILSAWEDGRVEGINVYLTRESDPARLDAFYRREMRQRGFKLLTPPAASDSAARGLIAEQAGQMVAFSFSKTQDGQGVVSIEPL